MIRRGRAQDRLSDLGLIGAPPSAAELARLEALFAGRREIPEPELDQWITAAREPSSPRPAIALA